MDEQIREESGSSFISDILFVLKRNIILILVVILLFTAGGVGYSFVKEPSYTASYRVIFQAKTNNSGVTQNINAMRAYVDTAVDFCDEGVVLDRANYYYENWVDEKANGTYFSDYLKAIELDDKYSEKFDTPEKNYSAGNVEVTTVEDGGSTQFIFSIKYTDVDKDVATEKAGLLTYAFKKEINQIRGN